MIQPWHSWNGERSSAGGGFVGLSLNELTGGAYASGSEVSGPAVHSRVTRQGRTSVPVYGYVLNPGRTRVAQKMQLLGEVPRPPICAQLREFDGRRSVKLSGTDYRAAP